MVLIYGEITAGRIHTREYGLVSTKFIHLFWLPFIPWDGIQVEEEGWLRDQGLVIPIQWKSVLAAYLRVLLFAGAGLGFAMLVDARLLDASTTKDAKAWPSAAPLSSARRPSAGCGPCSCWARRWKGPGT